MANKAIEFTIRGKIYWCKLIGPARPYSGDPRFDKGPSWSVEVDPDEKSREKLEQYGLEGKLKKDKKKRKDGTPTKNPRPFDYLRLTILENKPDGTKNKRPEIIDASGRAWGDDEIGNESVADILVRFVDYGTTQGLYYKKMRVLKHVPYEGGGADFEPLSEDDEFFASSTETVAKGTDEKEAKGNLDDPDLEDDLPF